MWQNRTSRKLLQATQRLLGAVNVSKTRSPKILQLPFPVFTQRRANPTLFRSVGAITFYHQHQRKTTTGQRTNDHSKPLPKIIREGRTRLAATCTFTGKVMQTLLEACRGLFSSKKLQRAIEIQQGRTNITPEKKFAQPCGLHPSKCKRYME